MADEEQQQETPGAKRVKRNAGAGKDEEQQSVVEQQEEAEPDRDELMDPDKPHSAENPVKRALVSQEGEDVRGEREQAAAEAADKKEK